MIYLDPKIDVAFKKLFANRAKKDILTHFLNSILDRTGDDAIVGVEILDPANHPDAPLFKRSFVDVRCTDKDGKIYVVEMQIASQFDFVERAQYYAADAIAKQLDAGEEYRKINPVYLIAVLDFNL